MLKPPPRKVATKGAPKRVIARRMGLNEDSHVLVRHAFINDLKNHKSDYLSIYGTKKRYKLILDGLHPLTSKSGIAPPHKWLTTSDMGHIIATCYNRAVVLLTLPEMNVSYVKKRAWFYINPTYKLDELKAKLYDFFIQIGSNHITSYVVVQVPTVDLGEEKEEDFWKTVYFPLLLKDDSNVDVMFSLIIENNILHLYVRSVEV
ncbi:hypothetical protein MTR_2g451140 [Medicago truncatula]|uniref:Uncharacterized protein n=1 Tax=Medicago truncatula TaxID=3880 RepID=A0A072V998_MEDTR|nr:hypothetical protein MTR_2g451140 [Medicago truncatula]